MKHVKDESTSFVSPTDRKRGTSVRLNPARKKGAPAVVPQRLRLQVAPEPDPSTPGHEIKCPCGCVNFRLATKCGPGIPVHPPIVEMWQVANDWDECFLLQLICCACGKIHAIQMGTW